MIVLSRTNSDVSIKAASAGSAQVSNVLIARPQDATAFRDYSQAKFQYAMAWLEFEVVTGLYPSLTADVVSRAIYGNRDS